MRTQKRFNLSFIIFSIGYILLGVLMLVFPDSSERVICYVLGAIAIILGIICIASYFTAKDNAHIFRYDLAIGVVLLIAGIYLIARPTAVWEWLPVLLGLCIVFDSIIKLQHSFDLKRIGSGIWWVVLIAAVATAVLGVLLILNAFGGNVLIYYFGIVLIADGVVNLLTVLLLSRRMKKLAKTGEAIAPSPSETPQ